MRTFVIIRDMEELWQLYGEDAQPLTNLGATKNDALSRALLHGASHVWMWRIRDGIIEVLLQKRASNKRTWPNKLDISAAGHIDLGETPLEVAIRETKEEIGIDVQGNDLKQFALHKTYLVAEDGSIENEFQWLYSIKIDGHQDFTLQESEVDSLRWVSLDEIQKNYKNDEYVPHGDEYYGKVLEAIANDSGLNR